MSVNATTYSFHAAMNAKMTAVTIRGRLLDLPGDGGEERAQDPDREREVEGRVRDDERGVGVDEVQLEELPVEPHHQRRRREHLGDEHQEEELAPAPEPM